MGKTWQDELYQRYGNTSQGIIIPKLPERDREYECDDEKLRKILPERYFGQNTPLWFSRHSSTDLGALELLQEEKSRKRAGLLLITISLSIMSFVVYMSVNCYKASCSDCLEHLEKYTCRSGAMNVTKVVGRYLPRKLVLYLENMNRMECHCSVCIYNFFWNAETHFEKCYYSLLVFNTFLAFLCARVIWWLAFIRFKHL